MTNSNAAWSYSALDSYETCPKRHWHLKIKKDVVEEKSDQQNWGTDVHNAFAKRLKSHIELPFGMRHFESLLEPLLSLPGTMIVEQKLALGDDMQPAGWFAPNVFVRVVVDACFISPDNKRAMGFDWKTGKQRDDDDQLALMAAVMFAYDQRLETVDMAFVWLQNTLRKAVDRRTYQKNEVMQIWERFLPRVNAFQEAIRRDEFPAKPGYLCRRYCPVKSCPYHGG